MRGRLRGWGFVIKHFDFFGNGYREERDKNSNSIRFE